MNKPTSPPTNSETPAGYEVVDHTADWALLIYGPDMARLLVTAALGMAGLMVADLDQVPFDVEKRLELDALDGETLLVDWLSELAYWAEDEQFVGRSFEIIQASMTQLKAIIRGGRVGELTKHIKAVTYHNLEIIETDAGLQVTVVFDV